MPLQVSTILDQISEALKLSKRPKQAHTHTHPYINMQISYAPSMKCILITLAITVWVAVADNSDSHRELFFFRKRNHDPCKGARTIMKLPFAVTNIAAKDIKDNKVEYNFHSSGYPGKLFFLKDVTLCDFRWYPYKIVGTKLSESEFKSHVKTYLNNNGYDHVLFNLHGFNVSPYWSFKDASDYHTKQKDYLVIPIQWRTKWGVSFFSYEYDRNERAPLMGKQLAKSAGLFQADYKASIMCHSMGNYVFRVFAQNVQQPSTMFHNFFSVAADARMDMFSSDFNPLASGTGYEGVLPTVPEEDLGPRADELKRNGGYDISKLASNTHVIYNLGDHALHVRESFQLGWSDEIRKALGKFGDHSEQEMAASFDDKVKFHNFSKKVEEIGIEHNYQWYQVCTNLYIEWKDKDIASENQ